MKGVVKFIDAYFTQVQYAEVAKPFERIFFNL